MHGQGKYTRPSGETEEGMYKENQPVGSHVCTPKNGTQYLNVYNDEGQEVEKQNLDGSPYTP